MVKEIGSEIKLVRLKSDFFRQKRNSGQKSHFLSKTNYGRKSDFFFDKNKVLVKNRNLCQKRNSGQKSEFSSKMKFWSKIGFVLKNDVMVKNRNFRQKRNSVQKSKFPSKTKFCSKIGIFVKNVILVHNRNFCQYQNSGHRLAFIFFTFHHFCVSKSWRKSKSFFKNAWLLFFLAFLRWKINNKITWHILCSNLATRYFWKFRSIICFKFSEILTFYNYCKLKKSWLFFAKFPF